MSMNYHGIHHVTLVCNDMEETTEFYTKVLGAKLVKRTVNFDDPATRHFYFGDEKGTPGSVLTFFEYKEAHPARVGYGGVHHIAFIAENEKEQLEMREKLLANGVEVTPVIERKYFKSIYFRDPDGMLLEIATKGPGFFVDEEELGSNFFDGPAEQKQGAEKKSGTK